MKAVIRNSRKPRVARWATVAITAILALIVAHGLGAPAGAQTPPPQTAEQPKQTSDTAAVPAPTVQQADKGTASSSAAGSAINPAPGVQPGAAGSAGAGADAATAGAAGS